MADFVPIDEAMKSALKEYGEDFYKEYLRRSIIYGWKDIIGETNAKHIKPLRIEYKRLYVYVSDSSWRSTVYAYKSTYLKNINEFVGEELIDDIVFGKPDEKPVEVVKKNDEPEESDPAEEIKKINLTDEEIAEIEKSCEKYNDSPLKNVFLETSISRLKYEKYLRKKGHHECPKCGRLCKPEEKICSDCQRNEREKFYQTIRDIFYEVPFATYAEVKNEISNRMPEMLSYCQPDVVDRIKSNLVQEICSTFDGKDEKKIKFLVMLFKGVKPKDLTEKIISQTLYELRYDIPMKGRWKFEK